MGLTSASFTSFGAQLSATLAGVFPATIIIGGISYAGAWLPGEVSREAMVNGQVIRLSGIVRIPFTVLPAATPPKAKGTCVIAGVTYRIDGVTTIAHEGSHELNLEQPGR